MRPFIGLLHLAATSLLTLVLGVQVWLAGRGVFESPAVFDAHRELGYTIGFLALLVVLIAFAAGAGRAQVGRAVIAVGLVALQSLLVAFRADMPALAALHPVNGFLILGLSFVMLQCAWRGRPVRARITSAPSGR